MPGSRPADRPLDRLLDRYLPSAAPAGITGSDAYCRGLARKPFPTGIVAAGPRGSAISLGGWAALREDAHARTLRICCAVQRWRMRRSQHSDSRVCGAAAVPAAASAAAAPHNASQQRRCGGGRLLTAVLLLLVPVLACLVGGGTRARAAAAAEGAEMLGQVGGVPQQRWMHTATGRRHHMAVGCDATVPTRVFVRGSRVGCERIRAENGEASHPGPSAAGGVRSADDMQVSPPQAGRCAEASHPGLSAASRGVRSAEDMHVSPLQGGRCAEGVRTLLAHVKPPEPASWPSLVPLTPIMPPEAMSDTAQSAERWLEQCAGDPNEVAPTSVFHLLQTVDDDRCVHWEVLGVTCRRDEWQVSHSFSKALHVVVRACGAGATRTFSLEALELSPSLHAVIQVLWQLALGAPFGEVPSAAVYRKQRQNPRRIRGYVAALRSLAEGNGVGAIEPDALAAVLRARDVGYSVYILGSLGDEVRIEPIGFHVAFYKEFVVLSVGDTGLLVRVPALELGLCLSEAHLWHGSIAASRSAFGALSRHKKLALSANVCAVLGFAAPDAAPPCELRRVGAELVAALAAPGGFVDRLAAVGKGAEAAAQIANEGTLAAVRAQVSDADAQLALLQAHAQIDEPVAAQAVEANGEDADARHSAENEAPSNDEEGEGEDEDADFRAEAQRKRAAAAREHLFFLNRLTGVEAWGPAVSLVRATAALNAERERTEAAASASPASEVARMAGLEARVVRLEEQVFQCLQRYVHVDDASKAAAVAAYHTATDRGERLCTCAACGLREASVAKQTQYRSMPLAELERFKYDDAARERYESLARVGGVLLPVSTTASRRVALTDALSSYEGGADAEGVRARYHLLPEFVHEDAAHGASAWLCLRCAEAAQDTKKKLPQMSVAAGTDLGSFERLGLPELRPIEQVLLAPSRLYGVVVKVRSRVHGSAKELVASSKLTGHFILFPHEGRAQTPLLLQTAAECAQLLHRQLKVHLIGPRGAIDRLAKRALKLPELDVRPWVVCAYWVVLRELHRWQRRCGEEVDAAVDVFERDLGMDHAEACRVACLAALEASARRDAVGDEELAARVDRQAAAADVAGVRSHADTAAAASAADEEALRLFSPVVWGAAVGESPPTLADVVENLGGAAAVHRLHTAAGEMADAVLGGEASPDGARSAAGDDEGRQQSEEAAAPSTAAAPRLSKAECRRAAVLFGHIVHAVQWHAGTADEATSPLLSAQTPGPHLSVEAEGVADRGESRAHFDRILSTYATIPVEARRAYWSDGLPSAPGATPLARTAVLEVPGDGQAALEAGLQGLRTGLAVERSQHPVNEYATENHRTLMSHFWWLFPLGRGLPKGRAHDKWVTRHLMLHYSGRFARSFEFCMLLVNQLQRHAVNASVGLYAKNRREAFDALLEEVNSEGFLEQLEAAEKNVNGPEARRIFKHVLPFLSLTGRRVPGGKLERRRCMGELLALARRYSVGGSFLSISPDDVHHPTSLRLCFPSADNEAFPAAVGDEFFSALAEGRVREFFEARAEAAAVRHTLNVPLPRNFEEELQRLAAENATSTTEVFMEMMEATMEHLVGLRPQHAHKKTVAFGQRPKGYAGVPLAWYGVFEVSGRLALHMHAIVFTAASAQLLADVAGHRRLEHALAAAIASQLRSELPWEVYAAAAVARHTYVAMPRCAFLPPLPHDHDGAFRDRAELVAIRSNLHVCDRKGSCGKGACGVTGCRFQKPCGLFVCGLVRPMECVACGGNDIPGGVVAACAACHSRLAEDPLLHGGGAPHGGSGARLLEVVGVEETQTEEGLAAFAGWAQRRGERSALPHEFWVCSATHPQASAMTQKFEVFEPQHEDAVHVPAGTDEVVIPRGLDRLLSIEPSRRPLADGMAEVHAAANVHEGADGCDSDQALLRALAEHEPFLAVLRKWEMEETVAERLRTISAASAAKLVARLRELAPCANGSLVEFSDMLSGCLGCNTAPYLLGASEGAKAAMFYMIKYVTKDSVELRSCLSLLVDAKRHIDRYPSVAEDRDTPDRTTKHFVARVNNAANMEMSFTQGVTLLLGKTPHMSSEHFKVVPTRTAVKHGKALLRARQGGRGKPGAVPFPDLGALSDEDDGGTEDVGGVCGGGTARAGGGGACFHGVAQCEGVKRTGGTLCASCMEELYFAEIEQVDADNITDALRAAAVRDHIRLLPGRRPAARDPDNVGPQDSASDSETEDDDDGSDDAADEDSRSLRGHERFAHGDPLCDELGLESKWQGMHDEEARDSRDEGFAPLYNVDGKKVAVGTEVHYAFRGAALALFNFEEYCIGVSVTAMKRTERGTRGRRSNEAFPFHAGHPLFETHEQKLVSKVPCPMVPGKPPPKQPPALPAGKRSTAAWRKSLACYAAYMLANYRPWHFDGSGPLGDLSVETFRAWAQELERAFDEDVPGDAPDGACRIGAQHVAQSRLQIIRNVTHGLSVNSVLKKVNAKWRGRNRKEWPAEGDEAEEDADSCDGDDAEAKQAIAQEHRENEAAAEGPSGKQLKAMQEAESFVGALCAHLHGVYPAASGAPEERPPASRAAQVGCSVVSSAWAGRDARRCSNGLEKDAADNGGSGEADVAAASDFGAAAQEGAHEVLPPPRESDLPGWLPEELREITEHEYETLAASHEAARQAGRACDADAPLNVQQRAAGAAAIVPLLAMRRGREAGMARYDESTGRGFAVEAAEAAGGAEGAPIFMHGAAGTGKTTLVNRLAEIMAREGLGAMVASAYTGVAASGLRGRDGAGATTLLSLLNFGAAADKDSFGVEDKFESELSVDARTAMRRKFERYAGPLSMVTALFIDEISFVGPIFLSHLNQRLKVLMDCPLPFGGLVVILGGDFFQLPPAVPKTTLFDRLIRLALDGDIADGERTGSAARAHNPAGASDLPKAGPSGAKAVRDAAGRPSEAGSRLLAQCRRVDLQRTVRQAADEPFGRDLRRMRDVSEATPVSIPFLRSLKVLSKKDCEDLRWRFAPHAVLSNRERHAINALQMRSWAEYHHVPLLKWRRPLPRGYAHLTAGEAERLYQNEPSLWGSFALGAPAILTQNVNPTRGITNGTMCTFHSVTWKQGKGEPDHMEPAVLQRWRTEGGGGFAELEVPEPLAVNVALTFKSRAEAETAYGGVVPICPITGDQEGGVAVVPIMKTGGLKVELSTADSMLLPRVQRKFKTAATHQVEPAFALTDYKLQGKTLDRLVVSLKPRSFRPALTLPSVYVILSRVRTREGLRLAQALSGDEMQKLSKSLKHGVGIELFEGAYAGDKGGVRFFRPSLAVAAKAAREARVSKSVAKKGAQTSAPGQPNPAPANGAAADGIRTDRGPGKGRRSDAGATAGRGRAGGDRGSTGRACDGGRGRGGRNGGLRNAAKGGGTAKRGRVPSTMGGSPVERQSPSGRTPQAKSGRLGAASTDALEVPLSGRPPQHGKRAHESPAVGVKGAGGAAASPSVRPPPAKKVGRGPAYPAAWGAAPSVGSAQVFVRVVCFLKRQGGGRSRESEMLAGWFESASAAGSGGITVRTEGSSAASQRGSSCGIVAVHAHQLMEAAGSDWMTVDLSGATLPKLVAEANADLGVFPYAAVDGVCPWCCTAACDRSVQCNAMDSTARKNVKRPGQLARSDVTWFLEESHLTRLLGMHLGSLRLPNESDHDLMARVCPTVSLDQCRALFAQGVQAAVAGGGAGWERRMLVSSNRHWLAVRVEVKCSPNCPPGAGGEHETTHERLPEPAAAIPCRAPMLHICLRSGASGAAASPRVRPPAVAEVVVDSGGVASVGYALWREAPATRRIGTMVAGNSGRPGGACGLRDAVRALHAAHRTQEEDIVSDWLLTAAFNHEGMQPTSAVALDLGSRLYRGTICGAWGLCEPDGHGGETLQGVDYRTTTSPTDYAESWVLPTQKLSAKADKAFDFSRQYETALCFVAGPNAGCARSITGSTARTLNVHASQDAAFFTAAVAAAVDAGLRGMASCGCNVALLPVISGGLYAGPWRQGLPDGRSLLDHFVGAVDSALDMHLSTPAGPTLRECFEKVVVVILRPHNQPDASRTANPVVPCGLQRGAHSNGSQTLALPTLTATQAADVQAYLAEGPPGERVVLDLNGDMDETVTRRHMQRLRPGEWLSDELINRYFQLMQRRDALRVPAGRRARFFNTFFYPKLAESHAGFCVANVARWTRQVSTTLKLSFCRLPCGL